MKVCSKQPQMIPVQVFVLNTCTGKPASIQYEYFVRFMSTMRMGILAIWPSTVSVQCVGALSVHGQVVQWLAHSGDGHVSCVSLGDCPRLPRIRPFSQDIEET